MKAEMTKHDVNENIKFAGKSTFLARLVCVLSRPQVGKAPY